MCPKARKRPGGRWRQEAAGTRQTNQSERYFAPAESAGAQDDHATLRPAPRQRRAGWNPALPSEAEVGEEEGVVEGDFAEVVVAAGGAAVACGHGDIEEESKETKNLSGLLTSTEGFFASLRMTETAFSAPR